MGYSPWGRKELDMNERPSNKKVTQLRLSVCRTVEKVAFETDLGERSGLASYLDSCLTPVQHRLNILSYSLSFVITISIFSVEETEVCRA